MQQRPVYLNIFTFAFPITAIISILHRLSGVFLLILIPTFLGLLQDILYYPWGQVMLSSFWGMVSCKRIWLPFLGWG